MYSNTIYILNNTIIECFDIALNKTNKQKKSTFFVLFHVTKEEGDSHLFRMCQWRGNNLVTYKRAILLYISDNRIISYRG